MPCIRRTLLAGTTIVSIASVFLIARPPIQNDGPSLYVQATTVPPVEEDACHVRDALSDDKKTKLCKDFINERRKTYSSGVGYGTKTGYLFNEKILDESTLYGCRVVQVYGVFRHGTRNPLKKYIKQYDQIEYGLGDIAATVDASLRDVTNWTNPFDNLTIGLLGEPGMKEHYCLAKRFKKRFSQLFEPLGQYSPSNVSFMSSYKPRATASAQSFASGLYEDSGPLNGYQPIQLMINDTLLRFFDACPFYSTARENNKTLKEYFKSYLDELVMDEVRESIQRKIDPDGKIWNLTNEQVFMMYSACSVETASFGRSSLCTLFDISDKDVLEYYDDLKHYVKQSYDSNLNIKVACPMFADIVNAMDTIVHGRDDEGNGNPFRVLLRFGHAETLLPLVSALGLFRDDEPLRPDNYKDVKERKFRTAKICPFAANLVFALYKCEEKTTGNYKVRILLNEAPVQVKHHLCEKEQPYFCPYNELRTIINELSSKDTPIFPCKFTDFCST